MISSSNRWTRKSFNRILNNVRTFIQASAIPEHSAELKEHKLFIQPDSNLKPKRVRISISMGVFDRYQYSMQILWASCREYSSCLPDQVSCWTQWTDKQHDHYKWVIKRVWLARTLSELYSTGLCSVCPLLELYSV